MPESEGDSGRSNPFSAINARISENILPILSGMDSSVVLSLMVKWVVPLFP